MKSLRNVTKTKMKTGKIRKTTRVNLGKKIRKKIKLTKRKLSRLVLLLSLLLVWRRSQNQFKRKQKK